MIGFNHEVSKQNFVGNSLLPPLPFPPHHNPQSGFSVLTNVTLVHNHSWPALPQKYTGFKFLGYTIISTIKPETIAVIFVS